MGVIPDGATIIVDETQDNRFNQILDELKVISGRLRNIESLVTKPTSAPISATSIKVRNRINYSGDLVRLLEKRSEEASKLIKSAEDFQKC